MNSKQRSSLLHEGFSRAEAITRSYAQTFFFASRFLAADKRRACFSVYAACRLYDQAVDSPTQDPLQQLEDIQRRIEQAYSPQTEASDPLLLALHDTVVTYGIPQKYFSDLLEGMKMDLTLTRYSNFTELYLYCYRVAGVVGLMMTRIFGAETPEAEKHALDIGVAMQLTNILRDIKEDHKRGRIYLPKDEMKSAGVTGDDIAKGNMTDSFAALMRCQIERARSYYEEGHRGLEAIIDKNARLVALLMAALHERILDKIEQQRYNIFKKRAVVPFTEKICVAVPILVRLVQ